MRRLLTLLLLLFALLAQAQKSDQVIIIHTSLGDLVALLYDDTPKHKANFIKLARAHYYDSLLFHRVIAGFMIQGGDPESKRAKAGAALGSGGPGYTIEAEFVPKHFHKKGALAAARLADQANPTKASSGSQFYIVQGTALTNDAVNDLKYDQPKLNQGLQQYLAKPERQQLRDSLIKLYTSGEQYAFRQRVFQLAPLVEKETGLTISKQLPEERIKAYTTIGGTPHLDDSYTVFGELIAGIDVLDKIAAVKKDGNDRPMEDLRMFIEVKELSRKKITKQFGYIYPAATHEDTRHRK